MVEVPTPLDAYSSLLHLTAVVLAAGAHLSQVALPYLFIFFSATLNNIFIAQYLNICSTFEYFHLTVALEPFK